VYSKNSDVLCLSVLLTEYCCLLDFTVAPLSLFAKKYAIFGLSVLLAAYCHLLCPSEVKSRCYYSWFGVLLVQYCLLHELLSVEYCCVIHFDAGAVLMLPQLHYRQDDVMCYSVLIAQYCYILSLIALQVKYCLMLECTDGTVILIQTK